MNYPALRLHIIEDFAAVQLHAARLDRLQRWAAWRQEERRAHNERAYERQVVATIPYRGTLHPCPNCGRTIEYRPGSTRLFHTGPDRIRCGGATITIQGE